MLFRIILLSLLGITTACAPLHNKTEAEYYTVQYLCQQGDSFAVQYYHHGAEAVLIQSEQQTVLNREPTASGFAYGNGGTVTLRGKGDEVQLIIGRKAAVTCRSVR